MKYLNQIIGKIYDAVPNLTMEIDELKRLILKDYESKETKEGHVFTDNQAGFITNSLIKYFKTERLSLKKMVDKASKEIPGISLKKLNKWKEFLVNRDKKLGIKYIS